LSGPLYHMCNVHPDIAGMPLVATPIAQYCELRAHRCIPFFVMRNCFSGGRYGLLSFSSPLALQ
jgi:hypothetical protein